MLQVLYEANLANVLHYPATIEYNLCAVQNVHPATDTLDFVIIIKQYSGHCISRVIYENLNIFVSISVTGEFFLSQGSDFASFINVTVTQFIDFCHA